MATKATDVHSHHMHQAWNRQPVANYGPYALYTVMAEANDIQFWLWEYVSAELPIHSVRTQYLSVDIICSAW